MPCQLIRACGPTIPSVHKVLAKVFDQALAGGGAKSINFQELAADLAMITYKYPFRIPPCEPRGWVAARLLPGWPSVTIAERLLHVASTARELRARPRPPLAHNHPILRLCAHHPGHWGIGGHRSGEEL